MSGLPVLDELYPVCVTCRSCGESFLGYAKATTGEHRTLCDRCCQRPLAPKLTVAPPDELTVAPDPDPDRARKIAALKRKSFPVRLSGGLREWLDVFARILVLAGVMGLIVGLLGLVIRGLFWLGEAVAWFASLV